MWETITPQFFTYLAVHIIREEQVKCGLRSNLLQPAPGK